MPSLRQHLGALAHDWPRFLRHIGGEWTRIHNRTETVTSDGRGVRCHWPYGSDLDIGKVSPLAARWLLRRALSRHPIALAEAPAVLSGDPEASFVIGHRGLERLPNLLTTLRSIAGQLGARVEAIVVEQSPSRQVEAALPPWVRYVHTGVGPDSAYSRSAAFNAGVRIARANVLILHDNDLLVPRGYAAEMVGRARDGWAFSDLK